MFVALAIMKRTIILYAEDDSDDRQLMRETINALEPTYELVTANDGAEAMDALTALEASGDRPSMIILDMNMPRLDGRETLERVRSNHQWDDIPVCIFSTSMRNRFADLAVTFDVDIVTKPIKQEDMLESIKRLLAFCREC